MVKKKVRETAYAMARVAMGGSDTVARFSSPKLVDAVKELRAAEKAVSEQVDLECSQLEARIGAEADPLRRRELIRTRRRIRHRECIASDPSEGAQRVVAALGVLKGLHGSVDASFHQALAEGRSALRNLCLGSHDFRLSMLMSSASLSERLEAWKDGNDMDSQRDAALLKYWTRFSMKISPFSRFTAVSCLVTEAFAGGVRLKSVSKPGRLTRLNVEILERLEALRRSVPTIRRSGRIRVNPTWVWQKDLNVSFIGSGLKGEINDLKLSRTQARMLRRLQELGETTWAKAAPVVSHHLRIPAEQVPGVIDEMLEREIMVSLAPSHPMDPDWVGPWTRLLKKLCGRGGPDAGSIEKLLISLERLGAVHSQGLSEDYEVRKEQLRSIASAHDGIHALVPAAPPETAARVPVRRERLQFEDTGVRLDTSIPIAGYGDLCRILGKVALAFSSMPRRSVGFSPKLLARIARGGVSFMEFLRLWTESVGEQPKATASDGTPTSTGGLWLKNELQHARNALGVNLDEHDSAEIHLSTRGLVPTTRVEAGECPWHTCIIQKEDDAENSRIILNSGIHVGPMRLWSRFCDLFPARVSGWLQDSLADPDGETVYAEIIDWNFSNVNLHTIFTESIVLLSHVRPAHFKGNILLIPDLSVAAGKEGIPRLYCRKLGKFVIPVDMGFQPLSLHSPVYELLARLGIRNETAADSIGRIARDCFGTHTPRIVLDDRIIIAREAWQFSKSELQRRRKGQTLADFFSETTDWSLAHGFPNEVFVTVKPDFSNKDGALKSDQLRQRSADDYKPIYHRFDSALFLLQWERLVDKAEDGLGICEALPASAGNMILDSTRRCCEIAINWI